MENLGYYRFPVFSTCDMSAQPSSDGTYRIKVIDQNLYIQSVPYPNNPGLKLACLDTNDTKQQWIIKKDYSSTNTWTITSADNNWGVNYTRNLDTYWGYGYPHPKDGPSQTWCIDSQSSQGKFYSKIKLFNDTYSYCFDSGSLGSDAVHFYYDKGNLSQSPHQCFVFEQVYNQ
ncbi:hypothetical protein APHAL10511_005842 [Amanita phalloides]|nr:hypothetical protein APHAL10511_005842 [Amanita phalloides]